MREILFRGKSIDKYHHYGEWVYGKLLTNNRIITATDEEIEQMPCFDMCDYQAEVIPSTIGQYTGLTDKNGTKIFEGDIVRREIKVGLLMASAIVWSNKFATWWVESGGSLCGINKRCEVIGNIHDTEKRHDQE